MKTFIMSCLVLAACGGTFAQNASEPTTTAVGEVLVSTDRGISASKVNANGTLTPVAGSPFKGNVTGMAVSGSEVITLDFNRIDIRYYKIGSTGALTLSSTTNALTNTGSSNCGAVAEPLALDRPGVTVYTQVNGYDCSSNSSAVQSYSLDVATGQLIYRGHTPLYSMPYADFVLLGTDFYAFGANSSTVDEFMRGSNGDLTATGISFPIPAAQPGSFFQPRLVATDATNHVFAALQPVSDTTHSQTGPWQIATYTVGSSGLATTNSTATNMLAPGVGTVKDMKGDPFGKFMCVAGTGGSAVVSLHGGGPVTPFSKLTSEPTDQCLWGLHERLWRLSISKHHLQGYTPGPTNFTPGTLYIVNGLPRGLAVK